MNPGNRRAIVAALLANTGIAVAKAVGFMVTGASAMLAEAVHSLADSGNQGLLLWGGAAAARHRTPSHPFGHGRERYFWSFVVALVIFTLGGLFAIYEGAHKILDPHPLSSAWVAIVILAVGIVLEGFSFRTAIVEARRAKGKAGWWEFIRDTKSPELPVVLLEDLGALLGLSIALAGISTAAITGDGRWDGAGSIAIGVLLLVVAVVLAVEMKSLLIGEAAAPAVQKRIRTAMQGPDVERLIDLRTLHMGPDQLLVAAKVELRETLRFSEIADTINAIEARIRAEVPEARMIYIEPDVFHPDRGPSEATTG